jgi:AcrR family transcriptional regulator
LEKGLKMDKKKRGSLPSYGQTTDNENNPKGIRRRGEVLEAAILQAAWDELSELGYTQLTMEGVAARAKTNKAVLYRRWANKAKLVISVLHRYLPKFSFDVPDTGDLREDMLTLLHGITQPLQAIGAKTIHGLMVDRTGADIIASLPQLMHTGTAGKWTTATMVILKNAELRGEVNLEKISPRVISLPMDLIRFEILVTHEPISEKTILEIVDDIFLPLIHQQQSTIKEK